MENRDINLSRKDASSNQGNHSNTSPGTSYAEDTELNKKIVENIEDEELNTNTAGADPNGNNRFVQEANSKKKKLIH